MYHIIINPASRSGRGLRIWKEKVEPVLKQKNVEYRAYFSEKSGDVPRLAEQITKEYGRQPKDAQDLLPLVILGGDGTVNEVLQGITDPSRILLGYIPTGSSNDLARALKIPKDPAAALDLILETGKPAALDLGELVYGDGTRRLFAVSCGIGFDAAVCEEAMRSRIKNAFNKVGLGKLTYLGIALKQLFAAKAVSCRLTLDGGEPVDIHKILFVAGMVHPYEGGGFMFCPDATGKDGLLHLCAVGDLPKLLVLFALPTAFSGKHYRFRGITPYRAKSIHIETTAPLWVHTDGEVRRRSSSFTANCRAGSILFITPGTSAKS